jgi:alpha-tubulin suppressor-like RCC1 family protein
VGSSEPDSADVAPAGPVKSVECGDFTTCAIAGDDQLHCWGRDKGGELGDGAGRGERLKRGLVHDLGKVRKVALASQFGCALLENKSVKCWGTGRIGNDGQPRAAAKPMPVTGLDGVEELEASGTLVCARTASNVTCWGADAKTIGTPPKGSFTQVSVGFTHACALDQAGTVTCWGQGDWSEKGSFAHPDIKGATEVATGDRHACVLMKDKTIKCWGMNDAGQLGTKPDVQPHKKLAAVAGIANAAKVVAGEASTCVILTDGSVRCWGSNGQGELGLGKRTADERPSKVGELSNVDDLCLASAHACALTKDNKLLCWGANAHGQVGDGTKDRRPRPTPVTW